MNNFSGTNQAPGTGSNLHPQGSQAQSTVTGLQLGSPVSQGSNDPTNAVLSQEVGQSSLSVVSAPYSARPSAVATSSSSPLEMPTENTGIPSLALLLLGAFLLLAAAGTWNRYIKTPVPTRTKRR